MSPPVIILTGASRGVGLSIAHHLLSHPAHILAIARSPGPLEALHAQHPDHVSYLAADLSEPSTATDAVRTALERWGRIDALIVNHGALDPVARVEDADVEAWKEAFGSAFFGTVALVKECIPELRKSHGRIIFVSSGAAVTGYQGWGAYGAAKAAMNHLSITVAAEEPEITSIAIRPGVIDTQMQKDIREKHQQAMGGSHGQFIELKERGKLLRPEQPGGVVARLALGGGKELSGLFLNWNAEQLAAYQ